MDWDFETQVYMTGLMAGSLPDLGGRSRTCGSARTDFDRFYARKRDCAGRLYERRKGEIWAALIPVLGHSCSRTIPRSTGCRRTSVTGASITGHRLVLMLRAHVETVAPSRCINRIGFKAALIPNSACRSTRTVATICVAIAKRRRIAGKIELGFVRLR